MKYDEYSPTKSVGLLLTMIDVSKIHSVVLHRKALWQLVTSEEFKASVTEHVNRNSSIRSEDLVTEFIPILCEMHCFFSNVSIHYCSFLFGSAFSHKYIYGQAGLTKINKMT